MRVSITKYNREELLTTSSTLASALIEGLGRAGVAVAELDSDIILDKAVQMAIKLIDRIADVENTPDKIEDEVLTKFSNKYRNFPYKNRSKNDAIIEEVGKEIETRLKKVFYNYKYKDKK